MLPSTLGRGSMRLGPKQINRSYHVSGHSGAFVNITAAHRSLKSSLRLNVRSKAINGLLNSIQRSRTLATRAASKPKAHTGRATAKTAKKTTTKSTTNKGTTKSKTATKKTVAKPKPKRKVKPRKVLTEEEKQKQKIKELKKAALKRPKQLPQTVVGILNAELSRESHSLSSAEASAKAKTLRPEELEHYNRLSLDNRVTNEQEFAVWVNSHSPDDIRKANNARKRLTALKIKGYRNKIQDERLPKQPSNAMAFFRKDRYASGEMAGISLSDAARMIVKEYKELPEAQKQHYIRQQQQDQARYSKEHQDAYGQPPKLAKAAHAA